MIPMPQRIATIITQHAGVCLAQTQSDFYLVGLDYSQGQLLVRWEPTTDFFASKSIDDARKKYLEYTGLTARSGDCSIPNSGREGTLL